MLLMFKAKTVQYYKIVVWLGGIIIGPLLDLSMVSWLRGLSANQTFTWLESEFMCIPDLLPQSSAW